MPFLTALRSKDDRCWILRLWPRNFVIISESLAANLEKVRQTSVWQTVPRIWFIWLWYLSFCLTYKSKSLRNNKNQNFRTVCHTEVCLTFSRLAANLSEMITKFRSRSLRIQHQSSFDLNGLKTGTRKYWWEVWILGRGCKKTKCPQQWGVCLKSKIGLGNIYLVCRQNVFGLMNMC